MNLYSAFSEKTWPIRSSLGSHLSLEQVTDALHTGTWGIVFKLTIILAVVFVDVVKL